MQRGNLHCVPSFFILFKTWNKTRKILIACLFDLWFKCTDNWHRLTQAPHPSILQFYLVPDPALCKVWQLWLWSFKLGETKLVELADKQIDVLVLCKTHLFFNTSQAFLPPPITKLSLVELCANSEIFHWILIQQSIESWKTWKETRWSRL